MAEILTTDARSGLITLDSIDPGELQDELVLSLPFDRASLPGGQVAVSVTLEQSPDGSLWWPIGGLATHDLASLVDRRGNPLTAITARFKEQIYRSDAYFGFGFDRWGGATYELDDREGPGGGYYFKLAFNRRLRVKIETSRRFAYGCDVVFAKGTQPETPIGRRSASLLGAFTAAESATNTATTGSRTTVAGTVITGQGGAWQSAGNPTHAITDNKSNGFTEAWDEGINGAGSDPSFALAYNHAGTRGTSHTVTETTNGASGCSVGAQEWDGIAASPTITVGTVAQGSSTTPSCAVTPGVGPALVIGHMMVDATVTIGVTDGTEAQEIDENNDRQAMSVGYKVASSGATTIAWSLSGSGAWMARAISFEEDAGGEVVSYRKSGLLTLGVGA